MPKPRSRSRARRNPQRQVSRRSPTCTYYYRTYDDGSEEEEQLCVGARVMFTAELEFEPSGSASKSHVMPGEEAIVKALRAADDDTLEAIILTLDDGSVVMLQDDDQLADISEWMVEVSASTPSAPSTSDDLDFINAVRRRTHERPLDPQRQGWTPDDIATEARRLRAQGNPTTRGTAMARKRKRRKKNPLSTAATAAILVGAAAAAGVGGYYVYRRWGSKLPGMELPPAQALEDLIVEGATVGDASWVASDIMQPILIQVPTTPLPVDDEFDRVPFIQLRTMGADNEPILTDVQGGVALGTTTMPNRIMIVSPTGTTTVMDTSTRAIDHLVTGISPEASRLAYELALLHIGTKGVVWADAAQRDAAIRDIAKKIAPAVDWSQGLMPYTYGSAPWTVWSAIQLLGTVANQSYFNKQEAP